MSPGRKILLGGSAAGVALFVWGVVSFTLLPLVQNTMRTLPEEETVIAALRASGAAAGIYLFPGLPDVGAQDEGVRAAAAREREEKLRRGPVGVLVYDPSGLSPRRMFRPLARGLAASLLAGLFAAWALSRARIGRHAGRIAFVVGLGIFGWLLGPGTQGVWFNHPVEYLAASLIESVIGWTVAGVVLTRIVRP